MTTMMLIGELVLDYNLYPRHELDGANVAAIARAIDAGEKLPPIVADSASKRVVDGFHRMTAYERIADDLEIEVELVEYDDEQAVLLDAIARNARHGVRLTRYDQARSALLAEHLSIDESRVAGALGLTVTRLGELKATKTALNSEGEPIPIRATVRHLAGSRLSKRKERAERRTGGMSIAYYANQVTNALRGDLVDWHDEGTVRALRALQDELGRAVKVRAS